MKYPPGMHEGRSAIDPRAHTSGLAATLRHGG